MLEEMLAHLKRLTGVRSKMWKLFCCNITIKSITHLKNALEPIYIIVNLHVFFTLSLKVLGNPHIISKIRSNGQCLNSFSHHHNHFSSLSLSSSYFTIIIIIRVGLSQGLIWQLWKSTWQRLLEISIKADQPKMV